MSREHKLGYCGVAKAGSTSVHSHFLTLANETSDGMDGLLTLANETFNRMDNLLTLANETDDGMDGLLTLANETDDLAMRRKARDIFGWRKGLSVKAFMTAARKKEILTFLFVRHPLERKENTFSWKNPKKILT